ncbi:MAG: glycosyl hydrolase-related protein [Myxococcota bacterium]|nr:glycosyl hydrolase-related protein [Myxococcota bacterium]
MVPMTHLDIGFTAPPEEVAELYKANIDHVIEYATSLPDFRWTVSQVWMVEQWLARTSDPEQIRRFFDLVRAGRISIGAGYANQHTAMMGEEETARFLYPAKRLAVAHDIELRTFLMNDVPGWSWSLPQALRGAGVEFFLAGVNDWLGGVAVIPRERQPFHWLGPDGSDVLTWIAHNGYGGLWGWGLDPFTSRAEMEQTVAARLAEYEAAGYPYDAILVCGALFDNWDSSHYTANFLRKRIDQWNEGHEKPRLVLATPEEFFDHMEATYAGSFPSEAGDSSGLWDALNTITPASTAMVRWAHDHAPAAEKLDTLNWLLGQSPSRRTDFDLAFTRMLQADEHCTGGVGWPGRQDRDDVEEENAAHFAFAATAWMLTAALLGGELEALGLAARSDRHARIVVYNSLSWSRTAPVEATIDAEWLERGFFLRRAGSRRPVAYQRESSDEIVFIAEDVPPLGYRVYELVPRRPRRRSGPRVRVRKGRLVNRFYDVRVDPVDGRILGIRDRRARRELVGGGRSFDFNSLIKAHNVDDFFWGSHQAIAPAASTTTSRSSGPVFGRITITRPDHPLSRTEIVLYHRLPRVDIIDTIDRSAMAYVPYAEHSWHYSLTFPFDLDLRELSTRVETAAGFLSPPDFGYLPGAPMGAHLSQHAIDLREGSAYGVTVAHREAFVSTVGRVQRAFYDPVEPTLFFRTVQKSDEGDTRDQGVVPIQPEPVTVYDFAFSLQATQRFDPVDVSRFGWGFTTPLRAEYVAPGAPGDLEGIDAISFLELDAPNVHVVDWKIAEFGDPADTVLRVREIAGTSADVTLRTPLAIRAAQEATVVEEPIPDAFLPIGPVRFEIGPYEVKTIRLRVDAPAGPLARGRPEGTRLATR